MTHIPQAPLRLKLNGAALVDNWRWLREQGGSADCGAAIKADGYGTDAVAVMTRLAEAGCRDFFVATWAEALALLPHADGLNLSVFHGVREADMAVALGSPARPVLNSPEQVARWRDAGGGACDVMIDTGMNRLGLDLDKAAGIVAGLQIETVMSHLACADETHFLNDIQHMLFSGVKSSVKGRRYSLANSAGVCLGEKFAFDLTRPGLSLYGGVPRAEAQGYIRNVVTPQAQVIQRRTARGGEAIGYNATYSAEKTMDLVVLNIGYADGYLRAFSNKGYVIGPDGMPMRVLGRVSMDLTIVDASDHPEVQEGDWLDLDYSLPVASAVSGLSQYELLTGLGSRFDRIWI